jgi:hypothetical protein
VAFLVGIPCILFHGKKINICVTHLVIPLLETGRSFERMYFVYTICFFFQLLQPSLWVRFLSQELVRLKIKVSRRLPASAARVQAGSVHVAFLVDKVALGSVFSEYFGFPCQFAFHRLLDNHHQSPGAGTVGQTVAAVPRGLSITPR